MSKQDLAKRKVVIRAQENMMQPIGKSNLKSTTSRPVLSELSNKPCALKPIQNKLLKKPEPLAAVKVEPKAKATKPVATQQEKQENSLLQRLKQLGSAPNKVELSQVSKIPVDLEDDPLLLTDYIKDIMTYYLKIEEKYAIQQDFLSKDHCTDVRMRSLLVDWMAEVHSSFKFLVETFHMSVSMVDRYLQINKDIGRKCLQLVGTSAMLVAAKYEEMYIPDISDFTYICDDSFTKKQLLGMEKEILKKLDFNIGRPLSIQFLRRLNKIANVTPIIHTLGKYLLELALFEYSLCHIKPSLQAAAACCLSIAIMSGYDNPEQAWTKLLVYYSTYSYNSIKTIIHELAAVLMRVGSDKHQGIRKRYSESKHNKIALNPKLTGTIVQKLAAQIKTTPTSIKF